MNVTSWANGLEVTGDGIGIVSHAGLGLLRRLADTASGWTRQGRCRGPTAREASPQTAEVPGSGSGAAAGWLILRP